MGSRVVALTGAFGFLGRRLVKRLEAEEDVSRVVALDVRSPLDLAARAGQTLVPLDVLEQHPKLSVHSLDLLETGADQHLASVCENEGVDVLVHLAFLSSPTHASDLAHELETIGTLYVKNAARAVKLPRVVCLSSTMCYGARHDNPASLRESDPLRADRGRYLKDRIEVERQMERLAERGETAVAIARLGAFIGPRSKHFWSRYLTRKVVATALGYDPLFQLLHIDDAIDGLMRLALSDITGALNIVGDGVLPLSRVIRGLGNRPLPIPATATHALLSNLWRLQLLEMPPSFTDFLQWEWIADGARMQALGFAPKDIHEVLDLVREGSDK